MFKTLFVSSTSACFELCNNLIYYSNEPYTITVNGQAHGGKYTSNVFSVFGLIPDTEYKICSSLGGEQTITTKKESACLRVQDFGAKGDGETADTRAIQTAINACPKNGRVLIDGGTFYTAPLVLKSDMTLEIAADARLLASTDVADYPVWPGEVDCAVTGQKVQCATWEGDPRQCYQSFISAHHAENIAVVGEGEINGNGSEGIWYINHKAQTIARPRLMFLNNCKNVTIHGITGGNSASWNFHPFFSRDINFYDIRVNADKYSPNTDGCNPESCDGVNIIGAVFSVGDDCIAIKSGKIYMGKKYKTPSQNITVRNCIMQFGHGGVVLGSEMAGGVRDISVSRCLFRSTDRGLRIKTRRGRGKDAVIDNIKFENIRMENVLAPLVINMFYFCDPDGKTEYVWSKEKLPVDERTPYIGRFHFKDMLCTDVEQAAGFFYGLPEQPIKEIFIENVSFSVKHDAKAGTPAMMSFARECLKEGLIFNNVERVRLKNVTFSGIAGKEVTAENTGKVVYE